MRLIRLILRLWTRRAPPPRARGPEIRRELPREMRVVVPSPHRPPPAPGLLRGMAWVVDGDTIVIDKVSIRIAGIDAPELDHPFGKQAKWALLKLCKGQVVTARILPEMSYDRLVAECALPDGRDLAAEMVRLGLALDWPRFSGGKYRHLEPEGVRKKLWRASLRQRGMMGSAARLEDGPAPPVSSSPPPRPHRP